MPRIEPSAVPRRIGSANCLQLGHARQEPPDRGLHHLAGLGVLEAAQDFGDAEHAHAEHGDVDAVGEPGRPKVMRSLAGLEVGTDGREQDPDQDHGDRLEDRTARQQDGEGEAHHASARSTRPGRRPARASVSGAASAAITHRRDRAGEERADRRHAERDAGPPLAAPSGGRRWTVTTESTSPGMFDQDRRRRAAVLRAVIDARQHDQRADRIEPEGQRQQDRDGRDRPDPGSTPISVPTRQPTKQSPRFLKRGDRPEPKVREDLTSRPQKLIEVPAGPASASAG